MIFENQYICIDSLSLHIKRVLYNINKEPINDFLQHLTTCKIARPCMVEYDPLYTANQMPYNSQ